MFMLNYNYSRKRILIKKVCPICKKTFRSYYSFQIYCDICKKLNSFQHKKKLGLWKPKVDTPVLQVAPPFKVYFENKK